MAAEQRHEKHTSFDLKTQLEDVVDSTELMFTPQHVDIELNAPNQLSVTSNPNLLNQIIGNILSNAYTHAFRGIEHAKVLINVRIEDENVFIEIQNNGLSIPAEVAERMFDPFYTTARNKGGIGLGLSAAFNAATLLHGAISFEPTSSLGGPMFIVRIPINGQAKEQ